MLVRNYIDNVLEIYLLFEENSTRAHKDRSYRECTAH